jgi:hypothetical protein
MLLAVWEPEGLYSLSKYLLAAEHLTDISIESWLALLLGRFRLTVSQCLYEYFNLVSSMTRRKAALRPSPHTIHRNCYDVEGLTDYVDYLTRKYKTGQYLLDNDADGAGCKHT